MTSKEVLEKIKEIIRSTRDTDLCHFYHLSTDLTDKEVKMFNIIESDLEILDILLNAIHLRSWEEDETTPAVRIELSLGDLEKVIKRKKEVEE